MFGLFKRQCVVSVFMQQQALAFAEAEARVWKQLAATEGAARMKAEDALTQARAPIPSRPSVPLIIYQLTTAEERQPHSGNFKRWVNRYTASQVDAWTWVKAARGNNAQMHTGYMLEDGRIALSEPKDTGVFVGKMWDPVP